MRNCIGMERKSQELRPFALQRLRKLALNGSRPRRPIVRFRGLFLLSFTHLARDISTTISVGMDVIGMIFLFNL
jgi:hypothetical protein